MNAPICVLHHKPMRLRRGKFGKFWSCPEHVASGRYCTYRAPRDFPIPDDKETKVADEEGALRGRQITRTAIAKAFIMSGASFAKAKADAERWAEWVERGEKTCSKTRNLSKSMQKRGEPMQGSEQVMPEI